MSDDLSPLSDAELAKLCDVTRCGPTMVRVARELVEARKDRARLDWFDALPCAVIIIRDQPKADSRPKLREWIDRQMTDSV